MNHHELIALYGRDPGDQVPPDDCLLCGLDLTGARTLLRQGIVFTVCPGCGAMYEGKSEWKGEE